MFASNIHINDAFHGFETANKPYKYQKMFRISPIRIESGCWIGQNVVIRNHGGSEDIETEMYNIRDGIVVVPKGIVIPDNTII